MHVSMAQKCQSQQFGSMFGKNMGGTFNMMNVINDSMGMIKKDLYKAIKMNIQNIVEYEFSFSF